MEDVLLAVHSVNNRLALRELEQTHNTAQYSEVKQKIFQWYGMCACAVITGVCTWVKVTFCKHILCSILLK